MDIKHLKYTVKHKKAFLKVEKELLGKNTVLGYLHDLDKVILYLLPINSKKISKLHRKFSNHHIPNCIKKEKYLIQSLIDWECARVTKPDKPLTARETLVTYYSDYYNYYIEILEKLGL